MSLSIEIIDLRKRNRKLDDYILYRDIEVTKGTLKSGDIILIEVNDHNALYSVVTLAESTRTKEIAKINFIRYDDNL